MEGDSLERIAFYSHITPKSPVIPSALNTEASAKVASEESPVVILHTLYVSLSFRALRTPKLQRRWSARNLDSSTKV